MYGLFVVLPPQDSTSQRRNTFEHWMPRFLESLHHLTSCGLPFSFRKVTLVSIPFLFTCSAPARISSRNSWQFRNLKYIVLNFLFSSIQCHWALTWRWFDLQNSQVQYVFYRSFWILWTNSNDVSPGKYSTRPLSVLASTMRACLDSRFSLDSPQVSLCWNVFSSQGMAASIGSFSSRFFSNSLSSKSLKLMSLNFLFVELRFLDWSLLLVLSVSCFWHTGPNFWPQTIKSCECLNFCETPPGHSFSVRRFFMWTAWIRFMVPMIFDSHQCSNDRWNGFLATPPRSSVLTWPRECSAVVLGMILPLARSVEAELEVRRDNDQCNFLSIDPKSSRASLSSLISSIGWSLSELPRRSPLSLRFLRVDPGSRWIFGSHDLLQTI